MPVVSFALPCHNEEDVLRGMVERLVGAFSEHGVYVELVLVDNGSTDGTGRVIDELIAEGLPVVKEVVDINEGYGYGVLRGLGACRGRYVGFMCADEQVEAKDVVRVYEMCSNSKTPKLVKVRRRFRMDGLRRKLISIAYNALTTVMFGNLGSLDINGNPKIFSREYLDRMNLASKDWFLDAEVMIKAKRLELEVLEFNVLAQMREGGSSNVRVSTCWEFLVNLLRYRFGHPLE